MPLLFAGVDEETQHCFIVYDCLLLNLQKCSMTVLFLLLLWGSNTLKAQLLLFFLLKHQVSAFLFEILKNLLLSSIRCIILFPRARNVYQIELSIYSSEF